jgi:esterase/lipase superfamily enzyme
MALSFIDAVGLVLPIVLQMSGREDIDLHAPLGSLGFVSDSQLDALVALIEQEVRDRDYRLAAGLLRASLFPGATVDALARAVARLSTLPERDANAGAAPPNERVVRRRPPQPGPDHKSRLTQDRPRRAPTSGAKGVGAAGTTGSAPSRLTEEAPPYFTVPVFYGTTRARTTGSDFYGTGRGPLRYGLAMASVPSERRLGDIPRPSVWTLYREDPGRHYLLREVEERSIDQFLADARRHMATGRSNEVFVFVHGFNVTFVDAVLRTAQIAADLNFAGAAMLFTWPSKGKLSRRGYTMDETEAEWTAPHLATFLRSVADLGAEKVHLIAHSMGNRVLTAALRRLSEPGAPMPVVFAELVLTAPDIDTDTFVNDIAPAILPRASRITLYASSKDAALAYSKRIHGYPRLGDSDENLVTLNSVDTIDVSAVDTNLIGHFYYGENRSVLADLFNLIKGQPVPRFGLRERKKGARTYWIFQP